MSRADRCSLRATAALVVISVAGACSGNETRQAEPVRRVRDGVVDVGFRISRVSGGSSSFFVHGPRSVYAGAIVPVGEGAVVPAVLPFDGEEWVPQGGEVADGRWLLMVSGCELPHDMGRPGDGCGGERFRVVEMRAGSGEVREVADLRDRSRDMQFAGVVGGRAVVVDRRSSDPVVLVADPTSGEIRELDWAPPATNSEEVRRAAAADPEQQYVAPQTSYCATDTRLWALSTPAILAGVLQGPMQLALVDLDGDELLGSADIELTEPVGMEEMECSVWKFAARVVVGVGTRGLTATFENDALTAGIHPMPMGPPTASPTTAITTNGRWQATADGSTLRIERVR